MLLVIEYNGHQNIDARPSDCIAIALRANVRFLLMSIY